MSKRNIKKEFIILGVIIIVMIGYLLFKQTDKVHYTLPEPGKIEAEKLTKIEIAKPGETITLVRKDDKWLIDPSGYPTDEDRVTKITEIVGDFALSELTSRSKNYVIYGLEREKAINVKAYEADKVVREFAIGKIGPTNNHTFVRLKDDTNVYLAKQSFRHDFEKKIDDLRDKTAMKIDTNEISGITVEKEGKTYRFTKQAPPQEAAKADGKKEETGPVVPPAPRGEPVWLTTDGKEGNKTELESLLGQFTDLKVDTYIEGKAPADFKDPVYTVKLKGPKDYELKIYAPVEIKEKPDSNPIKKHPVVSSENPYPFYLSTYKAERITKSPETLLTPTKK